MNKLVIVGVVVSVATVSLAQNLYSNQSSNVNVAQLEAVTTTRSGVVAGGGARWSEVQANGAGTQPESNTVAGFSVGLSGTTGAFRLADDFVVTAGGWSINQIRVYGYQTGSAAATNIFTGGDMVIRSLAPNDPNSAVLGNGTFAGSTNTIQWDAAGNSGLVHRIFNTNSPTGTAPGTTRIVREVSFSFANLNLAAGTYWLDYQLVPVSGSVFNPSTTHLNMRGVAGANALQRTTTGWIAALDAGNPATAPDIEQDLPFIISGTPVPEPATMVALGLGAAALLRRRKANKA